MSEKNKAILEVANAAIAEGNYEAFLAFCTDDTHWTFVGDKTLRGKEAVRQWMAAEYVEPPKNIVDHLIAEGDFVVALGTILTKNEDGQVASSAYCDIWRFRQGMIAELQAFVIQSEVQDETGGEV
jgi:ketosteroid isomerase-like protein